MGARPVAVLLVTLIAALGACGVRQEPNSEVSDSHNPMSALAAQLPGFSPCPENAPCRILPLGDSITHGSGVAGGYRVPLHSLARQRGQQITFVGTQQNGPLVDGSHAFPRNHEGYVGETIQQLEQRFESFSASAEADIVLLHVGTNDMVHEPARAPRRAADLIDRITSRYPDALVAVARIIPLMMTEDSPDLVLRYNDALAAVVQERAVAGRNVILVDHNTQFPPGALPDQVHPDQSGYEFMARTWYAALEPYLD